MQIVHTQCLLRVDGSILAGVFLTFSFCVAPESSYSTNAVISSLVIVWSSNYSTAASSTESMVASFNTKGGGHRNWWLFSSRLLHMDYYWVHQKLSVVLSRKTPLQQEFYTEYLSV